MRAHLPTAATAINHHQAADRITRRRRAQRDRAERAAGDREIMDQLRGRGPEAVIDRMAQFIVTRAAGDGSCTEAEILRAGFTEDDMKLIGKAKRRAAELAPGLQGGA